VSDGVVEWVSRLYKSDIPVKVCVQTSLNVSASSTSIPEDDGTGEILEVIACTLKKD
jgi:hypothetical protein